MQKTTQKGEGTFGIPSQAPGDFGPTLNKAMKQPFEFHRTLLQAQLSMHQDVGRSKAMSANILRGLFWKIPADMMFVSSAKDHHLWPTILWTKGAMAKLLSNISKPAHVFKYVTSPY